MTVPSSWF